MWVYSEGSANKKREDDDDDDAERTSKLYYEPPHLGGEDATAVCYSSGNLSLQIFITAYHRHPLSPFNSLSVLSYPFSLSLSLLSFLPYLSFCSPRAGAMRQRWRTTYIRIPSRRFLYAYYEIL